MIRGITVTLYERRTPTGSDQATKDEFNRPIWEEIPVQVKNVLVTPAGETGEEILDTIDLVSRRAAYTLGLPKGDRHEWEGCRVSFWGEDFRVIGKPTQGIEDMIPLKWNRKVRVERIE